MFFLLFRKRKRRKLEARKSQRIRENSRFIHKRIRKTERLSLAPDFLRASDARKKSIALRNIDGTSIQMKVHQSTQSKAQSRTHFVNVSKNPICIRRDLRRKFLFASGLAGKIKVRRANWKDNSKVVCK